MPQPIAMKRSIENITKEVLKELKWKKDIEQVSLKKSHLLLQQKTQRTTWTHGSKSYKTKFYKNPSHINYIDCSKYF